MSYLNNNTGYRETLLSTRSVYKKGSTILEPDGIVKNVTQATRTAIQLF